MYHLKFFLDHLVENRWSFILNVFTRLLSLTPVFFLFLAFFLFLPPASSPWSIFHQMHYCIVIRDSWECKSNKAAWTGPLSIYLSLYKFSLLTKGAIRRVCVLISVWPQTVCVCVCVCCERKCFSFSNSCTEFVVQVRCWCSGVFNDEEREPVWEGQLYCRSYIVAEQDAN